MNDEEKIKEAIINIANDIYKIIKDVIIKVQNEINKIFEQVVYKDAKLKKEINIASKIDLDRIYKKQPKLILRGMQVYFI